MRMERYYRTHRRKRRSPKSKLGRQFRRSRLLTEYQSDSGNCSIFVHRIAFWGTWHWVYIPYISKVGFEEFLSNFPYEVSSHLILVLSISKNGEEKVPFIGNYMQWKVFARQVELLPILVGQSLTETQDFKPNNRILYYSTLQECLNRLSSRGS